jgi:hypothetical protein
MGGVIRLTVILRPDANQVVDRCSERKEASSRPLSSGLFCDRDPSPKSNNSSQLDTGDKRHNRNAMHLLLRFERGLPHRIELIGRTPSQCWLWRAPSQSNSGLKRSTTRSPASENGVGFGVGLTSTKILLALYINIICELKNPSRSATGRSPANHGGLSKTSKNTLKSDA